MALTDWSIITDNVVSTVVEQSTFDGSYNLDFGYGVSGSNYSGSQVFFPAVTGGVTLSQGVMSWAIENKPCNTEVGAIIRNTSPALSGSGYLVSIDLSHLPHARGIGLYRGSCLGNREDTLQTSTLITGGVSGAWCEYMADFHMNSNGIYLNIDIYSNEGTRSSPNWVNRLNYMDTNPITGSYSGFVCNNRHQYYIQRVAGTGISGYSNNAYGRSAQLDTPVCVVHDANTDKYIIADYGNAAVRHMESKYPYGVEAGIAYGDILNLRSACSLNGYVWIKCSDTIYKYNPATKSVDASVALSGDNTDGDICTDGTDLYMTNMSHDGRIFKMITTAPYTITTVAGHTATGGYADIDGVGTAAAMRQPCGITYYNGNFYFTSRFNGYLRKMTPGTYAVTTIAGTGSVSNDALVPISGGYFYGPISVVGIGGPRLLVGCLDKKIKMFDLGTQMVSTLSGDGVDTITDGPGLSGSYGTPFYMKNISPYDSAIFVPSYYNDCVWRHPVNFQSEVIIGCGSAAITGFGSVKSGTGRSAGIWKSVRGLRYYNNYLYYMDNSAVVLFKINPKTLEATLVAGSAGDNGHVDNTGTSARFNQSTGMTIANNKAYIGELGYVRTCDLSNMSVSTLITWNGITCWSTCVVGDDLYTGWDNCAIYKCPVSGGTLTRIAGQGGGSADIVDHTTGTSAYVEWPFFSNESYDASSNTLYFADNHSIRKVVLSGNYPVTTIAGSGVLNTSGYQDGTGTAARFYYPEDLVLDSNKNNLYVLDTLNDRIRKILLSDNSVTTYTGQGTVLNEDSTEQVAGGWRHNTRFWEPKALSIIGNNLYTSVKGNIVRTLIDDNGLDIEIDYLKIKRYI